MGAASITIAVNAKWNGDQLAKAEKSLQRLSVLTAASTRSTTSDLAKQGASWADLGGKIYNAGVNMEKVGTTLTQNVTVPLVTLGKYASNSAIEFDTAMANVRKTSDMTDDQIEKLAQSALELSKTQPVSADTILNIEALGSQLGVSNDKLESFAKTVSGLDIATNMDFETAGTQMAQFANITSMSQDEFENYASTIVDLGNNLATTESDISNMSLRLAGLTTSANFSQAEILGMSGAMSSLGINAEAGGSAMTQIVAQITKAVENGGDSLEEYAKVAGVSADEFASKWQSSPMEALEMVIEGIHNLDESGQGVDTTLSNLGITSIRQTDVMRRLAGNTDTLKNAVDRANTAWGENTALTDEVNSRNESLESRLQVLQNKVEAVAIQVGRPLVEALISAADAAQPLIDVISNVAQSFADSDTETQQMILGLVGAAAAAGPLVTAMGKVTQGVGLAVTAFGKVQQTAAVYGDALNTVDGAQMRNYASANTMATNLALVNNKAAIAAGGAENYVKAWEGMTAAAKQVETFEGKIAKANEKALAAEKTAQELGKTAENDAKKAAELGEAAKQAGDKVKQAGGTATQAMKDQAKEAQNAATAAEKVAAKSEALSNKASAAAKSAAELESSLKKEAETAKDAFEKNANLVTSWSGSNAEAKKAAKGIDTLKEAAEKEGTALKQAATTTGNFKSSLSGVGGAIKTTATNIGSMVTGFLKANAVMLAITAVTAAAGAAYGLWAEKQQKAKEAQDLLNGATTSAETIMQNAATSASGLGDAIGEIDLKADDSLQALKDLNESVGETFGETAVNNAKLDQYVATIEELGNKSDLSATEQWRLKDAVEKYNDICGTSYEVTEDANGQLQITADKTQVATDKLRDNAKAWKEKAAAEAYSNAATKYLEQEIESAQKLQIATEKATKAKQDYGDATAKATEYYEKHKKALEQDAANGTVSKETEEYNKLAKAVNETKTEYDEATGEVNKLTKAHNTASESAAYFEAAAAAAASGLDESMQKASGSIATSLTTLQNTSDTTLESIGLNTTDLSVKLAQAGVSSETMSSISSDAFAAMAASCGGNIDTLVQMIGNYNNTPIVNKDGTVTVDSNTLLFANGQVVEWNGTGLVYKSTGAAVEYGEVTDATGAVLTYDKTGLYNKDAKATVDSETVKEGTKNKKDYENQPITNDEATAKAESKTVKQATKNKKDYEDQEITNDSASASVYYATVPNAVEAMKAYERQKINNKYARVQIDYVTTSSGGTSKLVHAAGGIRTHADGGIVSYAKRYHAHGNIVNNPGAGVPLDIVGEAGAEAIVPLTNRKYSKPFARTIAEQMGSVGVKLNGGDTYILNINGIESAGSERSKQLLQALFDEYQLTNQMGVY